MFNITIPMDLVEILKSFEAKIPGTEFRYVGGCIRDTILGIKPKDWDIVTDASPEQLESLGLEKVGKDFPVFLFHDLTYGQIEIACCRTERKVGSGHNGFEVKVCKSFEDDLLRRDLTINAVAWHHKNNGTIYAPIPLELLEHDFTRHTLCHVSPAFSEDPLRVLRVARFAAKLSDVEKHIWFSIDKNTKTLMESLLPELCLEPVDRIRKEFESAMLSSKPSDRFLFFSYLIDCKCNYWFQEIDSTAANIGNRFYVFPETCKQRTEALYLHFANTISKIYNTTGTNMAVVDCCNRLKINLASEMRAYIALKRLVSERSIEKETILQVFNQLKRGKFPANIYFEFLFETSKKYNFYGSTYRVDDKLQSKLDMYETMYLAIVNMKFTSEQTPQEIKEQQLNCITQFLELYHFPM